MNKKIIVNVTPKHYNALLLEDNELSEYHQEKNHSPYQVGNVYLGTIKKLIPSLNAAFVDIGHEKLAFLHYSDISPHTHTMDSYIKSLFKNKRKIPSVSDIPFKEITDKNGEIKDVLKEGQKIIVQISKEPISTKGIRVTSCINLSGRYLILTPFQKNVTISKKIRNSAEKNRLEQLINSLKRENFGVIVRTLAKTKEAELLDKDFEELIERWENGMKELAKNNSKEHVCLIKHRGAFYTLLQDLLNEDFDQIVIDDVKMHAEVKNYVTKVLPGRENIVNLYQGSLNIFQYLGIERKVKNLLSKIVGLPGGGYLIIEHTEAMHVIDVNTGNRINLGVDQETLAMEVNLAAAKVIAQLLRFLGDGLGGITLVDFVGMRNPKNKQALYEAMCNYVKSHRFKVELSRLSRFGLMEITRPRIRSFNSIENEETCPTCHGTGTAQPSLSIAEQLEQQVKAIMNNTKFRRITLYLHPFLYAYINRGLLPKTWQWWFKYKKSITICEDPSLAITDYNIIDDKNKILAEAPKLLKRQEITYSVD